MVAVPRIASHASNAKLCPPAVFVATWLREQRHVEASWLAHAGILPPRLDTLQSINLEAGEADITGDLSACGLVIYH